MKATTLFRILGLGVTLLAFTMTVSADTDGKILAGASCQPQSQTDAILRDNRAMVNLSDDFQLWTCPIVKDAVDADAIVFARITVIDNNNEDEITCTLISATDTGDTHDGASGSTFGTPGAIGIDIVPGQKSEVASVDGGYYIFLCFIPGKASDGSTAGVVSYEIHERND
jgi:hypothetical protein